MGARASTIDRAERNIEIKDDVNFLSQIQEYLHNSTTELLMLEEQLEKDRTRRAEERSRIEALRDQEMETFKKLLDSVDQRERDHFEREDRIREEYQAEIEKASLRYRENSDSDRAYHFAQLQELIEKHHKEIIDLRNANFEAEQTAHEKMMQLYKKINELQQKLIDETERHSEIRFDLERLLVKFGTSLIDLTELDSRDAIDKLFPLVMTSYDDMMGKIRSISPDYAQTEKAEINKPSNITNEDDEEQDSPKLSEQ